jgi:hypothetical protein
VPHWTGPPLAIFSYLPKQSSILAIAKAIA